MQSVLLLMVNTATVSAWSCGIGPISGALSFVLSLPSDYEGINNCCQHHNLLQYEFRTTRRYADDAFCRCMESFNSWYVQQVLKPVFCTTVELYRDWSTESATTTTTSSEGFDSDPEPVFLPGSEMID